jgi:hypothetical protein
MIYTIDSDMTEYLADNPDEKSDQAYVIIKSKTPAAIFKKYQDLDAEVFAATGEHAFAFSE